MAESWSVYIVPKAPWRQLREAAKALVSAAVDEHSRFGVAAFNADHLIFQVELDNGFLTLAGWEESGLILHEVLGGRVTEIHGTSSSDTGWVAAYDRGRTVDRHDSLLSTMRRLKRFGVDLGEAVGFGGFGTSPAELVEDWTLPLDGPDPDPLQELRFDVLLAQHTEDTTSVCTRVEQAVEDDALEVIEATDLLWTLERDRAIALLKRAPVDTEEQRLAVVRRCTKWGVPEHAEAWADAPDALPLYVRLKLLRELGREADAMAVALEADRAAVGTYIAEYDGPRRWFADQPEKPLRTLVQRAMDALRPESAFEPPPTGLVESLRAAEVPALTALAEELTQRVAAVAADPVPFLRAIVDSTSNKTTQREYLGRLALELHSRDAPDALEVLRNADREYVPDPEDRAAIKAALDRRKAATPAKNRKKRKSARPGLPEQTPARVAEYESFVEKTKESPRTPGLVAQLARARFDAGFPDAGPALEDAYIPLGHDHPMRRPLEEALAALGLF